MYVPRAQLEERLRQALVGNKYIVIHGESGNGKTWLYKRVFANLRVRYQVVNLANVLALGGFKAAFNAKLGELGHEETLTRSSQVNSGVRPWGVGIDVQRLTVVQPPAANPFVALLQKMREIAGGGPAALVFDNFEALSDDSISLRQLASFIISADEDIVGQLGVKLLVVGVPGDIRTLIARSGNAATISNRLTELPEVARMTAKEATALMRTGLEDELGLTIDTDHVKFYENLCFLTDRIAQQIHELCLKIAYEAQANRHQVTEQVLSTALQSWADDTLSADWAVIQGLMNVRESSTGRKNQLLYALGRHDLEDFRYTDIEKVLRTEFPRSTFAVGLNVAGMLTSFSSSANPLLRRTPNQDAYRFVSPKLRMAIRTRLRKTSSEAVEKTY